MFNCKSYRLCGAFAIGAPRHDYHVVAYGAMIARVRRQRAYGDLRDAAQRHGPLALVRVLCSENRSTDGESQGLPRRPRHQRGLGWRLTTMYSPPSMLTNTPNSIATALILGIRPSKSVTTCTGKEAAMRSRWRVSSSELTKAAYSPPRAVETEGLPKG